MVDNNLRKTYEKKGKKSKLIKGDKLVTHHKQFLNTQNFKLFNLIKTTKTRLLNL